MSQSMRYSVCPQKDRRLPACNKSPHQTSHSDAEVLQLCSDLSLWCIFSSLEKVSSSGWAGHLLYLMIQMDTNVYKYIPINIYKYFQIYRWPKMIHFFQVRTGEDDAGARLDLRKWRSRSGGGSSPSFHIYPQNHHDHIFAWLLVNYWWEHFQPIWRCEKGRGCPAVCLRAGTLHKWSTFH